MKQKTKNLADSHTLDFNVDLWKHPIILTIASITAIETALGTKVNKPDKKSTVTPAFQTQS